MTPRTRLRTTLRARRHELDAEYRIDASMAICQHLVAHTGRVRSRRIAAYVASDCEADPGPFLATARSSGHDIYLPVLDPLRSSGMRFVLTGAGQALIANRYGIPEPVDGPTVALSFIDVALVPLVGFDAAGNRIGMGAGFYDRCFAFLNGRSHWRKPLLIGVAFDCQEVDHIEPQVWDVPLHAVVTESGIKMFRQKENR